MYYSVDKTGLQQEVGDVVHMPGKTSGVLKERSTQELVVVVKIIGKPDVDARLMKADV